jgi:hypothetical protein
MRSSPGPWHRLTRCWPCRPTASTCSRLISSGWRRITRSINDLETLAERMKDWTGRPGGVDERGLYFTTTNNPQGRWDWYEIGGRWNGLLKRASRNVISTRALRKSPDLKDLLPYYVLTPDGTWLEHERYIPDPKSVGHFETKPDDQWLAEVIEALDQYPDSRVVCVDIHC